jgi:transmembrane sensor
MNKELINKFLNNNCSTDDYDDVVEWIKEFALDEESRQIGFDVWKNIEVPQEKSDAKAYAKLFDKIKDEINQKQSGKILYLRNTIKWFSRVAAILIIPLLGVLFYLLYAQDFKNKNNVALTVDSLEIISPIGSRTVAELSDGTIVYLNHGSSIKYPARFTGKNREVRLSGEGYFKVAPNPDRPFVVQAGKLNITAIGTEFNVSAYSGSETISTTLVSGKVLLEKILPGADAKKLGIMVPGQHVEYHPETEKITSSIGKVEKYIAWMEGKIVFDNDPISKVTEVLEKMFHVDFEVADDVKYLSYTVTFYNDPLHLILELMTETTPITYKYVPRKRLPDGSYSKQKIKIYKNNQKY